MFSLPTASSALRISRLRTFLICALGTAAACDSPQPTGPTPQARTSQVAPTAAGDATIDERPVLPRADVELTAHGPFRPGLPINVNVVTRANRGAPAVTVTLSVLDEDVGTASLAPGQTARLLSRRSSALGQGDARRGVESVVFSKPGYYRVLAAVHAAPPSDAGSDARAAGDTVIIDDVWKTLWVVVDEHGGRLTDGYDRNVGDATRQPRYGAYGPFVEPLARRATGKSSSAALGKSPASSPTTMSATSLTPGGFGGHVYYHQIDVAGSPLAPVAYAGFAVACFDPDGQLAMYAGVTTDANGYFEGSCFDDSSGWSLYDGLHSGYVNVYGSSTSDAVVSVGWAPPGTTQDIVVTRDQEGRAYVRLNEMIPVAFAKFGYSRPAVNAFVATTNSQNNSFYSGSQDNIQFLTAHIFGGFGEFTIMHEYGHAFHWRAIEAPARSGCNGTHTFGATNTQECAFVEGFADFFSAWVNGFRQGSGTFTDNCVETCSWTTDGKFDEARVAALLYDLVDNGSEPNGAANDVVGDDDSVQLPASWLVQLMRSCNMFNGSWVSALYAADQLVYCLEGNTSAYSDPTHPATWTNYPFFTAGTATPAGWDPNKIRALWHHDLYGVGPLP